MKCEYCNLEYNKIYGSGRFCSKKCASGFSTKEKRLDINRRVSDKAKRSKQHLRLHEDAVVRKRNDTMLKRYGTLFQNNTANSYKDYSVKHIHGCQKRSIEYHKQLDAKPFEDLSTGLKMRRLKKIITSCEICHISEWQNQPIKLEIDHIDGNKHNNDRSNLRVICPNCHAYTPTYRGKNKIKSNRSNITDEQFAKALHEQPSIRQALITLGLSPWGGNYTRAKRIKLDLLGTRI